MCHMHGFEDNMIAMVGPSITINCQCVKELLSTVGPVYLEIIPEAFSGCIVIIYDALL